MNFQQARLGALTHVHAENWHLFGPLGTATILLPVWLLGALLAEQAASLPTLSSWVSIWFWRSAAWLGSWISEIVHFKLKISYTLTMIAFGALAYFWIRKEIEYSRFRVPNRFMVAAGAWSYSLYLVHAQGMAFYERLPIPNLGHVLTWSFTILSAILFAYLFYISVERPSHRLARMINFKPSPNALAPSVGPDPTD